MILFKPCLTNDNSFKPAITTHIYIYIYTYIHACMHTYTHTYRHPDPEHHRREDEDRVPHLLDRGVLIQMIIVIVLGNSNANYNTKCTTINVYY